MNIERFHSALLQLKTEEEEGNVINLITSVVGNLSQTVQAPQNAQFGEAFKQSYSLLLLGLEEWEKASPGFMRYKIYEEIDAIKYFGSGLRLWVETIFNENKITPATALRELQILQADVSKFYANVNAALVAFTSLNVPMHELGSGEAEVGMSIPKNLFSEELEELEKEFHSIDRAFRPFKEMADGDMSSVTVKAISASEWQVFLDFLPMTALAVAAALERIAQLYKTNLEIKVLKQQLEEKSLPESVTTLIQEHIEKEINEGLSQIASDLVGEYYKGESGRENELKTGLNKSLKYLAHRLDEGATIDVSMEPPEEVDQTMDGEELSDSFTKEDKALLDVANKIERHMNSVIHIQALDKPVLGIDVEADGKV